MSIGSYPWGMFKTCAGALRNASHADKVNPEFLRKVADYVADLEANEAAARSAALEEAAKVAAEWPAFAPMLGEHCESIAAAIRKLKT